MPSYSVITTYKGVQFILRSIFLAPVTPPPVFRVRLFTNTVDPTSSTEFTDLVEATFPGYSPVVLTPSSWDESWLDFTLNQIQTVPDTGPPHGAITFTSPVPVSGIMGLFVTIGASDVLLNLQAYEIPISFLPGQTFVVQLNIVLSQLL